MGRERERTINSGETQGQIKLNRLGDCEPSRGKLEINHIIKEVSRQASLKAI